MPLPNPNLMMGFSILPQNNLAASAGFDPSIKEVKDPEEEANFNKKKRPTYGAKRKGK
jgi:hypothetical protein